MQDFLFIGVCRKSSYLHCRFYHFRTNIITSPSEKSMKKYISLFAFGIIFSLPFVVAQTHDAPVGVFDSGTGGLTVLQAIITLDSFNNVTGSPGSDGIPDFSNEQFQYLADQANMPYGNYSAEKKVDLLQEHILKNMNFFLNTSYASQSGERWKQHSKTKVKMIVIACNTATAYALGDIKTFVNKKNKNIPVVGVINAGVKAAMAYQKNYPGTIGIFATAGTVASNGYPNTIKNFAKQLNMPEPSVVSQGGVGLAESIDRDWSYFGDTLTTVRTSYKGPSIKNKQLPIDPSLLSIYNFNPDKNKLLCEFDAAGNCLEMQLNDPANYVRYHLVTMLENMKNQHYTTPLNTLLLACTHYPYMRDTIATVLKELYELKTDGAYRYRTVLSPQVELIDPAIETAKEAYIEMRKRNLHRTNFSATSNTFFISVPNTSLKEIQLQQDGWFTYEYKYGRSVGANKEYVKYVPFDTKNVSDATYQRFSIVLPEVYDKLKAAVTDLK